MAEKDGSKLFLRIASADWYMCKPVPGLDVCRSEFGESNVRTVPVVRIFGTTPSGQTTCLHVHGVFPYLTIPCHGLDVIGSHESKTERHIRLAEGISDALNSLDGKSAGQQRVVKIHLIRRKVMSSLDKDEGLFLRIYFYFPGDVERTAQLLQNGLLLGGDLPTPEDNSAFISQLFLDYDLLESSFLHARNCRKRPSEGKPDTMSKRDDKNAFEECRDEKKCWNTTENKMGSGPKLENLYSSRTASENEDVHPNPTITPKHPLFRVASQALSQRPHHPLWLGQNGFHGVEVPKKTRRCDLEIDVLAQDISNRDWDDAALANQHEDETLSRDEDQIDSENLPRSPDLAGRAVPLSYYRHATGLLFPKSASRVAAGEYSFDNLVLSQRWDATTWDFAGARSQKFEDENDDVIPQLDGTSDDLPLEEENSTSSRHIDTSTSAVRASKSKIEDPGAVTEPNSAASAHVSDTPTAAVKTVVCETSEICSIQNTSAASLTSLSSVTFSSAVDCVTSLLPADSSSLYETALDFDTSSSAVSTSAAVSQASNAVNAVAAETSAVTTTASAVADATSAPPVAAPSISSVSVPTQLHDTRLCTDEAIEDAKPAASFAQAGCSEISAPEIPKATGLCKDEKVPLKCLSQRTKRSKSNFARSFKKHTSDKPITVSRSTVHASNYKDSTVKTDVFDANSKASESANVSCEAAKSRSTKRNSGGKVQKSKIAKKKKNTAKSTIVQRVEDRTNVFTTILSENPGVALYDQSSDNAQRYKHTAVVNFQSPAKALTGEICGLDGAVIEITTTPVAEEHGKGKNKNGSNVESHSDGKKTVEPSPKDTERLTRTRRPRPVSKNSYLEDPLYETVFDSDWDSEDSDVLSLPVTSTPRPNRPKRSKVKKPKETKRKRARKPRVITKWIIVNRFKGISNMKIGLWKIPTAKRVRLTPELLRLYELHSPMKDCVAHPPIQPPTIPPVKPRPMGRRSKHMLAILCPFGRKHQDEGSSLQRQQSQPVSTVKTYAKSAPTKQSEKEFDLATPEKLTAQVASVSDLKKSPAPNSESLTMRSAPPRGRGFDKALPAPADVVLAAPSAPDAANVLPRAQSEESVTKNKKNDLKRTAEGVSTLAGKKKPSHRASQEMNKSLSENVEMLKSDSVPAQKIERKRVNVSNVKNSKPTRRDSIEPPGVVSPILEKMLCSLSSSVTEDREVAENHSKPGNTTAGVLGQLPSKEKGGILEKTSRICTGKVAKLRVDVVSKNLCEASMDCEEKSEKASRICAGKAAKIRRDVVNKNLCEASIVCKEKSEKVSRKSAGRAAKLHVDVVSKNFCEASMDCEEKSDKASRICARKAAKIREDVVSKNLSEALTDCEEKSEKVSRISSGKAAKLREDVVRKNLCKAPMDCEEKSEKASRICAEKATKIGDVVVSENLCEASMDCEEKSEKTSRICEGKASKLREDIVSKNLCEVWTDCESSMESEAEKSVSSKKKSDSENHVVEQIILDKNHARFTGNEVMKTHPILSSIFARSKTLTRKSESKKKGVKSKRETRRKRPTVKSERNSPSPHDSDREQHIAKTIVPVSSRTVEPLCNRILPSESNETRILPSESNETESETVFPDKSPVKVTEPKSPIIATPSKIPVTLLEEKSPHSAEKKSSVIIVPSTKKVYSPSRKVTRNSVAVKLNSISPPGCMFTVCTDDSKTSFPPCNALLEIVFPSPLPETPNAPPVEPPRPWSPMLTHRQSLDNEESETNDLLEEFAESFGAATKMLDFEGFSNMDCIGQLLGEHHSPETQKESNEETPSNLKEESEKMLKHFDKIFKDVSSNAASTSKGGHHDKQSSIHLDKFEEETLLEFIDEMTSPTQHTDSMTTPLPMFPTLTPLALQDDSNSNPFPQMISPALRDTAETTDIPSVVLPSLPQRQEVPQPQRPSSAMPSLNHPNLLRSPEFCNPAAQPSRVPGHFMHVDPRPQSCLPTHPISIPPRVQRPASAMGHWSSAPPQSQPHPHGRENMGRVRSDISSSTMFSCKEQSKSFYQNSEVPQDRTYSGGRGSTPQPQSCQVPPQYAQMPGQYSFRVKNPGYPDPSQLPHSASAVEPPLQVFHTHVHHHHHVHSINNTPPPPKGSITPRPQTHPPTPKVKSEVPFSRVKMENTANMPWPATSKSNMATPEQNRAAKLPEKPKTKKTQFYVPNSPFPYPGSSPLPSTCIGPRGLVQKLTYVPTSVPRDAASDKSTFYNFDRAVPSPHQGANTFTPAMGQVTPVESCSAILKGACHGSLANPNAWLPTAQSGLKTARKPAPKSKQKKTKATLNPALSLPTLATAVGGSSAKTPYGLMKQNSLSAVKKKLESSQVAERKRKSISDFRAPPDTPTISLTGGAPPEKRDAEAFELSRDTPEGSTKTDEAVCSSTSVKSAFSTYNFASISDKSQEEALKSMVSKSLPPKTTKVAKPRHKRNSSYGTQRSDGPGDRPVPKPGEELILNFVTGEWEIVPAESTEKKVPIVFSPEEQALSNLETSHLVCAAAPQSSYGNSAKRKSPEMDRARDSASSQERSLQSASVNYDDFPAVKKKRKSLPKSRISIIKQQSTPEYVVSAVDLESSSPRLKLTLKKNPPARGKPLLSTLACDVGSITPSRFSPGRILKKGSSAVDDSDSSDSDNFALSTLKRRRKRKSTASEGSDSDFYIEGVSDGSTDDASDNADGADTARLKLPCTDFSAHLHAVRNMYKIKTRPGPVSVVVVIDKDQALASLVTFALQVPKKREATLEKEWQARTVKPLTVGRSRDGKLISITKPELNISSTETSTGVSALRDGPSPAKLPRFVPNVEFRFETQSQVSGEQRSLKTHLPTNRAELSNALENDPTPVELLPFKRCDHVAPTADSSHMRGPP